MSLSKELLEQAANTIRFLSADGVERAKSGHPGMPMGMAELGAVLWLNHLRYSPKDPQWLARDRFVLSNGHGSMFLYSMLHLSGYDVSMDDLKNFRQWESKTPGHPESFMTPGVETTTGPLGQGVGNAVGMAIGQKLMSERYTVNGFNPVEHKVVCFCGDGCLMEGVSSEASSIAGHLGLNNLILVYDDNQITIAGHTKLAFTEDVAKRYEAYGWRTLRVDGHDVEAIDKTYTQAWAEKEKPVLILAKTLIGKGSPNKANTHDVHGAPLGADELKASKTACGWPTQDFYVPEPVAQAFSKKAEESIKSYAAWQTSFSAWSSKNSELAAKLQAQLSRAVPTDLEAQLIAALPDASKPEATRKLSSIVLQAASKYVPSLIGGSADLEPSTLTLIKGSEDVEKGAFRGLNLRFGVREHGMGAIMNGLSYYGGYIPYGSTFFCFLDYMRPSVRLAALSHLPALYVYTHDSIFLGEDGPTHQPIEHLGVMRLTPNLQTFRPADGLETAVCYALALSRQDGPSALVLTRQGLPSLERPAGFTNDQIRKGAYAVLEPKGGAEPELVFVATGSEVSLAIEAAKALQVPARVVSMPCVELYRKQPESYRKALIPRTAKKVVIEAAAPQGWLEVVEGSPENTLVIGIEGRFGASAPAKVLAEKFGFTAPQIVERVKGKLL
jgi:transketolase